MRLLLDTHVFLWANADPNRLGSQRGVIEDAANELVVSAATSWEIAIKWALGRLQLPAPPARYVLDRIATLGATAAPIEHSHALAVATLPPHHDDPFDRLLVAQARSMKIPIATADAVIAEYGVDVLPIG